MLDRRSLLVAGMSSLASIMLPRVPGSANAFILPFAPTEAYADEEDPFKVLVLSRTMFGVVVVDVANKNTPIAGAQVTLTSRYAAGKQLTATTDDEGTAIFEIAPLSEGYVDEATLLDAYDFNGGISISMPGYRDVEIPLARIQSGTAITAVRRRHIHGDAQRRCSECTARYACLCRTGPPAAGRAGDVAHQQGNACLWQLARNRHADWTGQGQRVGCG